ncbi:MAG TPA: hypothetical protein VIQ31_15190, partial [Phormidium sp.]
FVKSVCYLNPNFSKLTNNQSYSVYRSCCVRFSIFSERQKKGNYLKPTGYMEIVMLGLSFGHHLTMFISALLGSGAAEISCNNLNRTLACTVAERLD